MKFLSMIFTVFYVALTCSGAFAAQSAKRPQTPVIIHQEMQYDACANGQITGLNPRGDGFLSVRSQPSAKSKELDRLYNGSEVYLCDQNGPWIGIVYTNDDTNCNVSTSWAKTMAYTGPCRSGWVHEKFVLPTAG